MRTLSATAEAARVKRGHAVLAGLKVVFPAPVGTIWFTSGWEPPDVSSSDLRKTVTAWGAASELLGEGIRFSGAEASVVLADPDGELRDWWEDHQFQRLEAEIMWAVFTPGEAEPSTSAAVQVLACTVAPPVQWSEGTRAVRLTVTDLALRNSPRVGWRAFDGFASGFDYVAEEDVGRVIPLVYGKAQRVPAIDLDGGGKARLVAPISDSALTMVVDDAAGFPQGTSIDIRVGREVLTGSFSGNTFTATARGKIIFSGALSGEYPGRCAVEDSSLIGYDDNWCVGLGLEMTLDGYQGGDAYYESSWMYAAPVAQIWTSPVRPTSQVREITRFDGSTGRIEFSHPFLVERAITATGEYVVTVEGTELRVKSGEAYKIRSIAAPHDTGEEVRLWNSGAVEYAVGMGVCSVRRVYVHGYKRPPIAGRGYVAAVRPAGNVTDQFVPDGEPLALPPEPEPDWTPLPAELWEVDTSHVLAATGKSFTTVALARPPRELAGWICDTNEVLADVTGPESGGIPIVNPADVIEDLLVTYGGITPDATTFAAAATKLASWRMNFALAEERDLLDLAADLAFQARSRLRWTGDAPELIYLAADGGAADVALENRHVFLDSLERRRQEIELAASEVVVSWSERGKRRTQLARDAAAETRLGRRSLEIECWAYGSSECPVALARYYLSVMSHLHDLARADATVAAVAVEPGDVASLDRGALLPATPVKGRVREAVFAPGIHPDRPASVGLDIKLFRWAGCSLGCEGDCETQGCETACESWFEPAACWGCEATCEGACELGCTAAAEFLCTENACQSECTAGCEAQCQATEQAWDCGACETTCQVSCESSGCESGCETSCESGCETGGEA